MHFSFRPLALSVAAWLSACTTGPDYVRPAPADDVPAAYKEVGVWKTAEPQAADSGRAWWTTYRDPVLSGLLDAADRANQSLQSAEAQYRQAQALADQARASFYPTVGANLGGNRSRASAAAGLRDANSFSAGLSASWQPDFWGAIRRAVEAGDASAAASADNLAATRLSIESSLAQDYLQLRTTDQLVDLYAATTAAYSRSLELTRAQYRVGVAQRSDVALAESQLATAQAAATDLGVTRSQLEHAIAILTGRSPANFDLPAIRAADPAASAATGSPGASPSTPPAAGTVDLQVPATPVGLPSQLLERRPDIAAAERQVAAANAQIGVARAAFYPAVTLSASGGFGAAAISSLFDAPSRVWALGSTLAQTLFDGGLRRARDAQAVAAYDATVAQYRQTVLTGFQQVEDNLAALRLLDQESAQQAQAVQAAQLAERLSLAQYRAGTATYLSVITAQTLSLTAQRTAVQLRGRQLAASVSLFTATGGGWTAADTAAAAAAAANSTSTEKPPT